MGIGVIGASSGAAEALPFGAASLLTSGFVDGIKFDYTANIAPGRYIIEGATQDGDSPIIAYAPNSNTTAIAYPGKSAILNVTSAETVIKLSAVPVVGTLGGSSRTGHYTTNGSAYYRTLAAAENTAGTTMVDGVTYYTGSTWYHEIYVSTDSGDNWTNVFSNSSSSNDPRPIEFIPDNGGYFLMGQNQNIWRSTTGTSWSQIQNVGFVHDFLNIGNGEVLAATNNGIYRSIDNGSSWTQVFSSNSVFGLARIESSGTVIGFNSANYIYSANRTNWTRNNLNYQNQQNISFQSYYGITALKNYAVTGNYVWPASNTTGAGFTLIDRFAQPLASTYQGLPVYRGSTDMSGPEWQFVVKMYENRGFLLSIGTQSGYMLLSTDGYSWTEVGRVAGSGGSAYSQSGSAQLSAPKIQNNKLIISTQMMGGPAKYTNSFAYKIFASAI